MQEIILIMPKIALMQVNPKQSAMLRFTHNGTKKGLKIMLKPNEMRQNKYGKYGSIISPTLKPLYSWTKGTMQRNNGFNYSISLG